eukprot:PhM_4_TR9506/c3_g1_i1/m.41865
MATVDRSKWPYCTEASQMLSSDEDAIHLAHHHDSITTRATMLLALVHDGSAEEEQAEEHHAASRFPLPYDVILYSVLPLCFRGDCLLTVQADTEGSNSYSVHQLRKFEDAGDDTDDDKPVRSVYVRMDDGVVAPSTLSDTFMQVLMLSVDFPSNWYFHPHDFNNVIDLGSFFSMYDHVRGIDMTSFTNVTNVSHCFLRSLCNLTHIDLEALQKLTRLPHDCLNNLPKLESLDLSHMTSLIDIGDNSVRVLDKCTRLLLPPNLRTVGRSFVSELSSLAHLDLSPLSQVSHIGRDAFLGLCSLEEVDLRPLSNITELHHNFMYGCTRLHTVHLPTFHKVHKVTNCFENCGLTLENIVNVTEVFPNATSISFNRKAWRAPSNPWTAWTAVDSSSNPWT